VRDFRFDHWAQVASNPIALRFRAIAAWRRRRKQRKELLEYLASDHRAAADIGYRPWRR
jgi:uncharacterized protein YjiS (DUF1127 family)